MENEVNNPKLEISDVVKELMEQEHKCNCKDKNFDIHKQLGNEVVTLYESDKTDELYKALLEFHANYVDIEKASENPFHESKYADLSTILDVVRPLLAKQGLMLIQFAINGNIKNSISVKTRLVHVPSGQFLENDTISLVPPKLEAQQYGSVETYLRRYSLQAILMLSFKCDDLDGADIMVEDTPSTPKVSTKPKSSRRSL